jgi:hypothetical protein
MHVGGVFHHLQIVAMGVRPAHEEACPFPWGMILEFPKGAALDLQIAGQNACRFFCEGDRAAVFLKDDAHLSAAARAVVYIPHVG